MEGERQQDTLGKRKHKVGHIHRRSHTARLPHTCTCCRHPILPGQNYVAIACSIDGHFGYWKYHQGEDDCVWGKG